MKLEEPGACRSVIVSHGSFHMRPHCTYIYNIIYLYLDLREGFNFSPKGFRQNSCPHVFFLPEAFFSTRGWFLMQCLPKRDFGHFRPFAGYFCPFAVSFRPTIVRIQRKTCRMWRLFDALSLFKEICSCASVIIEVIVRRHILPMHKCRLSL